MAFPSTKAMPFPIVTCYHLRRPTTLALRFGGGGEHLVDQRICGVDILHIFPLISGICFLGEIFFSNGKMFFDMLLEVRRFLVGYLWILEPPIFCNTRSIIMTFLHWFPKWIFFAKRSPKFMIAKRYPWNVWIWKWPAFNIFCLAKFATWLDGQS